MIEIQLEYYSIMTENSTEITPNNTARVEALLFVASNPVTASQLGDALGLETKTVESILKTLDESYKGQRGVALQWHGGRVQLTTAPEFGVDVERFLGLETTQRLSKAAIETLAIIAYRQPVTRPGIDAVRGVSSDGVIKSLLSKGLIQEVGRAEGPGRPILFSTTAEFLQHFGMSSLAQLPPYEIEPDGGATIESTKNGILKD
jgi:segregation and condensation protein B